jgi:hypothetical protein
MTRLHLLLTVASLAATAATVAVTSPGRPTPTPQAAGVTSVTARRAPEQGPADQVAWLAGFGTYNARTGSWNFVPNPRGC